MLMVPKDLTIYHNILFCLVKIVFFGGSIYHTITTKCDCYKVEYITF